MGLKCVYILYLGDNIRTYHQAAVGFMVGLWNQQKVYNTEDNINWDLRQELEPMISQQLVWDPAGWTDPSNRADDQ